MTIPERLANREPDTAALALSELPTRARVVVVGGGIAGASIPYHLSKLGVSDVVVVEPAPERRSAAAAVGASEVVDPSDGGAVEAVMGLTGGLGVSLVIDAAGKFVAPGFVYSHSHLGSAPFRGLGTTETLRRTLSKYEDQNLDVMIFVAQCGDRKHEDIMESIERFGKELLPEFKERHETRHRAWRADQLKGVDAVINSSV